MEVIHTVVFAETEGGGNPCPVVLNADGLSGEEMQAMTKEFRQESAFISKSALPDCEWQLRYFVPEHELEMCVHATIACATVLIRKGLVTGQPAFLETKAGTITVEWEQKEEQILVLVNQFLPEYQESALTPEEICNALCITEEELGVWPVEAVSTSRRKLIVPLKSRETLNRLKPDFEALWNLCDRSGTSGFYPFAVEERPDGPVLHVRQFPNRAGYPEDPATGVAASALSAYLIRHQVMPVKTGWNRFTVYQGQAMGRPGILLADACVEDGVITATRVCGIADLCSVQAESLV